MLKITPNPNLHRDSSNSYTVETDAGDKIAFWFWKAPHIRPGSVSMVPERTTARGNDRGNTAFVFDEKEIQQFITFLTENADSTKRQLI